MQLVRGPPAQGIVALLRAALIQKEVAVAGRRLGILVDSNDDGLDVLIAPAFSCRETTRFFEGAFATIRKLATSMISTRAE
jgi:hypothetical protein